MAASTPNVKIRVTPAMAAAMGVRPKRKPSPSAFKKGHPKPPNGGRKKGTKNKISSDMKQAFMEAFNRLGGVEFLVRVGKSKAPANKRALLTQFGKMLPLEVTGEGGGPLIVVAEPEDKEK